jgi:hypothetical protein
MGLGRGVLIGVRVTGGGETLARLLQDGAVFDKGET